MKVTLMNETGKDKPLSPLLISLVCCFMMARRLHACEMDLKFAALRKILLIIITSVYENVRSSNILTVAVTFTLYFLGLAAHYRESRSINQSTIPHRKIKFFLGMCPAINLQKIC